MHTGIEDWWVEKISRQCLENLINSLNKRFARRRLANVEITVG